MIHSCSSWQIGWKEHFLSCFALAAVIPAQHHSSPGPVWSACSGRGWGWRPWPQGMIWVCTAPCCPLVVVFRAAPCLHRTFSVLCWQKGTKINYRKSTSKETPWRLPGGNGVRGAGRLGGCALHQLFYLPQFLLTPSLLRLLWGCLVSVQFSHSVISDSFLPHGLQLARPPCP